MVIADSTKVIVLGSSCSGKTALVNRFVSAASFSTDYTQTFGAELFVKSNSDPRKATLNIWVTSGQERYRTLFGQFYLDASFALLCFDLMNLNSFQELPFWYNEVKRNAPDATILLVGTKGDEPDAMTVKVQDILKITKDWNVEYKATSAKTGTNIEELFESIYAKCGL